MTASFDAKQLRLFFRFPSVLVVALLCCSAINVFGQQKQKTAEKPSTEDPKIIRQQELLGRLVGIVNELKGESDKPAAALLQSEIADVLWTFDEPVARSFFRLAFDTIREDIANSATSSRPSSQKDALIQTRRRVSAIKVILSRYGIHDRKSADTWLREFENDVKQKQGSSNNTFRISPEQAELFADIALGVVSQNPKEAQRLGSLSLSGSRIPSSFGRLLMSLRDRDKALSDILFRQALMSLRSNGFAYDPVLISLTNYVFFSDGLPASDIAPADFALMIQYFVDAAAAHAARSRSGTSLGDEQSTLGSFYSFLNNRALPIVMRNAPDSSVLLQSHIGEIARTLTTEQRQQAEMLASVRQRNSGDSDIESSIRRTERERNVATRDFLFRSLATQLMRSEPERALEVARKIDNQESRAQTEDDVYLVLLQAAFANRADGEAKTIAVKFNDLSRRARWLAQIAGNLSRRSKDQTEILELLSEAHSIAAKSDNMPVKLDVLLLIAKETVRIDQVRGFEILSEAVSLTNRLEKAQPKSTVPAMRVVNITMVNGQEVSTDDRVTVDSIDFNQINGFAERDYLRTSFLGNEIKDRFLRSKYFIALARAVLQIPRQGSGYERTLDDLISN